MEAVLEFFSNNVETLEPRLLEVMEQIGIQLGRVIERKRAENAKFDMNQVLSNQLEGIARLDEHGRYVMVNKRYADMLGCEPEEMIGRGWEETIAEHEKDRMLELWHEMKRTGRVSSEVEGRRRDGDLFDKEVLMVTARDGDQISGHYCFARDITDRKMVDQKMQEAEQRFAAFMDNGPTLAWMKDQDFKYVYLNKSFETVFQTSLDAMTGKTDFDWMEPSIAALLRQHDERVLQTGETLQVVENVPDPDGESRNWLAFKFPFAGINGRMYVGGVAVDITDRKRMEEELRHAAYHDSLTGLPNRKYLMETIKRGLARVSRSNEHGFGIVFIDLDDFKPINDEDGHEAGDRVLIEVSHRIQLCLRPGDQVARLGGDEFAIYLDDINIKNDNSVIAARIHKAIQEPFQLESGMRRISASIGIVTCVEPGHTVSELLSIADAQMYHAKALGKGGSSTWGDEGNQAIKGI